MPPADQPDLDPVLADAVRRAYVRPVDEATAKRHVSAMVAAAASAGQAPVARRSPQGRRLWRPVLAAGAAMLLAPVGLAAAGVSLPDAVEEPYRAVGIALPHQTRHSDPEPAPAARPVVPRATPTTPATAEPPRRADERNRAPRADRRDRPRGKRPVGGGKPAGRQDKSRRPTGPQHKPKSPKSNDRPRRGKSDKPRSR